MVDGNDASKLANFEVKGHDYDTKGEIVGVNSHLKAANMSNLLHCMTICNESKLIVDEKKGTIVPSGLPTEAALKVLVEKYGNYVAEESYKQFRSSCKN